MKYKIGDIVKLKSPAIWLDPHSFDGYAGYVKGWHKIIDINNDILNEPLYHVKSLNTNEIRIVLGVYIDAKKSKNNKRR